MHPTLNLIAPEFVKVDKNAAPTSFQINFLSNDNWTTRLTIEGFDFPFFTNLLTKVDFTALQLLTLENTDAPL